jgi:hypothetical protein
MLRFQLLLLVTAFVLCQQTNSAAQSLTESPAVMTQTAQSAEDTKTPAPSVIIPAGTTVLMSLLSPVNTVSAQTGSGLYLETTADVMQQNRIVIPAKTLVQGIVARQVRPGRVKGRGQLQFHFTTLILPSNFTAPIAGSLQSLPGSTLYGNVKGEGAIQPVDQIDKDATVLLSSVIAGAAIGSVTHGEFRAGRGALIGTGFGLGRVLFKRGDDTRLPAGTHVEMVLDRSLTLPIRELAPYTQRSELAPANQGAPAGSWPEQRTRIPCPAKDSWLWFPGTAILRTTRSNTECLHWQ